jgi:hypothetical protein
MLRISITINTRSAWTYSHNHALNVAILSYFGVHSRYYYGGVYGHVNRKGSISAQHSDLTCTMQLEGECNKIPSFAAWLQNAIVSAK